MKKKALYAISLLLLAGALIIQSVWGAQPRPGSSGPTLTAQRQLP